MSFQENAAESLRYLRYDFGRGGRRWHDVVMIILAPVLPFFWLAATLRQDLTGKS